MIITMVGCDLTYAVLSVSRLGGFSVCMVLWTKASRTFTWSKLNFIISQGFN